MSLGQTFLMSLVSGVVARGVLAVVIEQVTGNRHLGRTLAKAMQVLVHLLVTVVVAPLTMDFAGAALTAIYLIWLMLGFAVVEISLGGLRWVKATLHSTARSNLDIVEIDVRKELPMTSPETPPSTTVKECSVLIFIRASSRRVIKEFIYQITIRAIVLGLAIKLLVFIESLSKTFVETIIEAIAGELGKNLGLGCVFLLLTLPRKLLEAIRGFFDFVFDAIFPD